MRVRSSSWRSGYAYVSLTKSKAVKSSFKINLCSGKRRSERASGLWADQMVDWWAGRRASGREGAKVREVRVCVCECVCA
eukprot:5801315-Pleurochrysis_carterae.AAC.2